MGRKIGAFGLVNYRRHPENHNIIVFGFNTEKEAEIFESELSKTKTWFEKDSEQTKDGIIFLYAVTESTLDEATRANGVVRRKFKDPLVKNKLLRFSLLLFIGVLLALAILGYVENPDKVRKENEKIQKDSTNLVK